jgi:choice-of-anchor B domain-containing protein
MYSTLRLTQIILVVLAFATLARADDDVATSLFVGASGIDSGDCDERDAPCGSLQFALSLAEPGQSIRVGAGIYDVRGVDPESFLWGVTKASGGWSAADDFAVQDELRNVTWLVGLEPRYRRVAEGRGFRLLGPEGPTPPLQAAQAAPAACTQGFAGAFPCRDFDFEAQIALSEFSSRPASASNLWGFVDLNDNREYVVIGLRNATSIVDVTNPSSPRQVASIAGNVSLWREVKLLQVRDTGANRWRAYAYVSTEAPGSGIQIIDMSGLPNSAALANTLTDTSSQHTFYISNVDYATNVALPGRVPHLYVAGSNLAAGAWRAYSLANPLAPTLAGAATAGSGYMHDSVGWVVSDARAAQCAPGHNPCEILADFNETTVEIWDVTNKSAPVRLSSISYPTVNYTHSGWPTDDGRWLFVHDELDEIRRGLNTHIYTLDLADLRAPRVVTSYTGPTTSTDHNGYVKGSLFYVSHYRRGLVVFDASNPNALRELGSFDTFLTPAADSAGTDGAWGVYPYFPSGTIAISDIDNGLFLVRDRIAGVAPNSGRLGFVGLSASASETSGSLTVRLRRTRGRLGAVSVQLATRDGTARAGNDYTSVSTTLNWADGDDSDRTVTIPLINDTEVENDETFIVALSAPGGGAALDGSADYTVALSSDDSAAPPPGPGGGSSGGGGGSLGGWPLAGLAFGVLLSLCRRRSKPKRDAFCQSPGHLA